MDHVISIYEAKTQLSKLVKQAQAGETVYIGAYGQAQAVIAPLPVKQPLAIGVWAHKKKSDAYDPQDLIGPDFAIEAEFEASAQKPMF